MSRTPETLLSLYYSMLRIRKVQLRIESLYHLDEMKTPVHLCIGQEAIPVGVSAHLTRDDYISSNHRGHGHYLAKGGDLSALIAELYCKKTGCSKGFGGSMHLVDSSVGHLGSSSIVGGGIPIGTGLALAIQMQKQPRVSVVFFGDGAADEGVLYESINFAMLRQLPVVFVFEDNGFAVCSRTHVRQRWPLLFHSAPSELLHTTTVDGNSVLEVYEAAQVAVQRARSGLGPSLIECRTYRMRGHSGAGSDAKLGYRTEEEIGDWERKDPVGAFRDKLLAEGVSTHRQLEEFELAIDAEIDQAFQLAQESPLPTGEDLLGHLFKD
ncbi:MAG: thiamine pyrophosphate-dependent dehydrogenase E1 component subunit alpha [Chloroflexi bacterium]|nr:thiamine pyrophosphate-dependent dehydrogenase E1 component subunit alpha [Chloroflexota bacterium]